MTDQPHTPNDELVAKVRAIAIDLDGDYRNGSWNEGAAKLFDQMIIQVEDAAEQRGAARVLKYFQDHVNEVSEYSYIGAAIQELIVQASENRADQEGAQDA